VRGFEIKIYFYELKKCWKAPAFKEIPPVIRKNAKMRGIRKPYENYTKADFEICRKTKII
jgi:hypothetical protein